MAMYELSHLKEVPLHYITQNNLVQEISKK